MYIHPMSYVLRFIYRVNGPYFNSEIKNNLTSRYYIISFRLDYAWLLITRENCLSMYENINFL